MDISDELSSKLSYLSYSTGRDGKDFFLELSALCVAFKRTAQAFPATATRQKLTLANLVCKACQGRGTRVSPGGHACPPCCRTYVRHFREPYPLCRLTWLDQWPSILNRESALHRSVRGPAEGYDA